MSQAYSSYYQGGEPPQRAAQPRGHAHSAGAMSRHLHRAHDGYTLTHAGRQVRIGPVAFWIVVGTLVIMGIWSIATGTYFAFRDDVLTRLIGRQAEMQFAYEDRIAELRAQVDRITSRQLLDQEQFEKKLDVLLQRQSTLESRSQTISSDLLTTGSIKPARSVPQIERPAQNDTQTRPSPINDTVIFRAPADREARLESRGLPASATMVAARGTASGLDGMLARVSLALDRVEQRQTAALANLEESIDTKARRIRGVLADLGVDLGKSGGGGIGGPYVPARAPGAKASTFEQQLYRINVSRAEIDRYMRTLVTVPVQKPVIGEVDMSSPFGMRMDPFLRGPAIHSGIDIRGDTGDPVRATANGEVVTASWQGGYGNMIEIDHGNGLSTRYGHLSKIEVKVGDRVRIGQTIGRIGSTGRSTGPHLHYETRVNDDPVDPQKFLRAGVRLGSVN